MPETNSPLGRRKIPGQQMREFTVPDESEFIENSVNPVFNAQRAMGAQPSAFAVEANSEPDLAEAEREIQRAREDRKIGKNRLSDGAKKRLDMLLGMTRGVRHCQIADTEFVLQTLKAKEMREAIIFASEFDGTVQSPFEIRKQFLARSLVQIGGIDIEQFIGAVDLDSKLLFIEELDDLLLNRLYDEYVALTKEAREKYLIKNESEVQEVVNDLKK